MKLLPNPLSGALAADQGAIIVEDQSGFSLIEVLMAVAVMGIAFVGILGAMATTALSSSLHRSQAVAELEVRRYAELVEAHLPYGNTYSQSDIGYDPPSDAPLDFTAGDPVVQQCLDAVSNPAACPGVAQVIRVTVDSTDGRVSEWVEFVKRAP
jgi:prepilin-type N-terminal cleavage/methylation domain-containing protein